MEKIPELLHVCNKDYFSKMNQDRLRKLLNEDIYLFLITRDSENDYYDLDAFSIKYFERDIKKVQELMIDVIAQLDNLGWKCKYSFNDTGLFIYSTETQPPSCW